MTTSFSAFIQQLNEAQMNQKASETINIIRNFRGIIEKKSSEKKYVFEIAEDDLAKEIGQLPKGLGSNQKALDTIAYKLDQLTGIDFHKAGSILQAPAHLFKSYQDYDARFQGKHIFNLRIAVATGFSDNFLFIIDNFQSVDSSNTPYTPGKGKPKGDKAGVPVGQFVPAGGPGDDYYIGYIQFKPVVGATFTRLDYYNHAITGAKFANDVINVIKAKPSVKNLEKGGKRANLGIFTPNQLKNWEKQGVSTDTLDSSAGIGKDIAAALKKLKIQ